MKKVRVGTASLLFGSLIFLLSIFAVDSQFASTAGAQETVNQSVVTNSISTDDQITPVSGSISEDRHDEHLNGYGNSERKFMLFHLVQLTLVISVILTGYSLATAGKLGRGWFVLTVIVGVATVIGRSVLSLFMEVSKSDSIQDWDEE